jgi:hypothetical protein
MTLYASIPCTGIYAAFGTINAYFDGEKISAHIGDYTSASWVPQGHMTCVNTAPPDYGQADEFGRRICDIHPIWWECHQIEILNALFGIDKNNTYPSEAECDLSYAEADRLAMQRMQDEPEDAKIEQMLEVMGQ